MACHGSFCRQTREDDAAKVHEATEQVLHEGGGMLIFAAASLMLALLIGNFLHHFEVPTFCQCGMKPIEALLHVFTCFHPGT